MKPGRSLAGGGLAFALSCAVLNKGAGFPLPGSPSQALRASSPKGGASSRRQTFRYIQTLSLWERGHREAMTERARTAEAAQSLGLDRASDRATLPQGSAKQRRSLPASILALSGASRQLPQRGSFFEKANFPIYPKPLTLGEVASRSDDGEGKAADKNAPRPFRSSLSEVCPIIRASCPPSVAYATSPSGRRESFPKGKLLGPILGPYSPAPALVAAGSLPLAASPSA